jgi:hypothetical protein
MSLHNEVVIVSGLPRSGTSLMMQMLHNSGIPALTDRIRAADIDNPRGYYEFEQVKRTRNDPSWVPNARGKVVKMVSSLLYDLPDTETYRIVFMERDINEVLASQTKMLERLGQPAAPVDQLKNSFEIHLKRLFAWLQNQSNIRVVQINYNRLISEPDTECDAIAEFLDHQLNVQQMLGVIDPALYRNRSKVENK